MYDNETCKNIAGYRSLCGGCAGFRHRPRFCHGGGGGVKTPTKPAPTASAASLTTAAATGNWLDADNYSTDWYDNAEPTATSYTISNAKDLAGLAKLVNDGNSFNGKTIKLGGDINLSDHNWTPIGTDATNSFQGTFNGDNHIISGLIIKDFTGTANVGLFGYLKDATIKNLTIRDVDIEVGSLNDPSTWVTGVGALAGAVDGSSTIDKVTVTGKNTIKGFQKVGGMFGGVSNSNTGNPKATNSRVIGDTQVTAIGYMAGGFAGIIGSAEQCYSTAKVAGSTGGGFAGYISARAASGNVTISSCYSTGAFTQQTSSADTRCGGFAGALDVTRSTLTMKQCYTISPVESANTEKPGAFIGSRGDESTFTLQTFENCSYNKEVAAGLDATKDGEVTGINALTTAEMTGDQWATNMGLTDGWSKSPNITSTLYYPYLTQFGADSATTIDTGKVDPEPTPDDNGGGDTGEPTGGQAVQPVDTGVTPATSAAGTGNVKTGDPGVLSLGFSALAVGAVGVALSRKKK